MSTYNLNEQGYDTLNYKSITIGSKHQSSVICHITLHPYTTLAAVYKVLFGLILGIKRFQLTAEVD